MTTTPKNRQKQPKGFVCPECGAVLKVLKTRQCAHSVIVRRRRCKVCNHRVTTEERPVTIQSGPITDPRHM